MTKHLEIPFYESEVLKNATVQIDRYGAYITLEGGQPVFVERRKVEEFIGKWNEIVDNC